MDKWRQGAFSRTPEGLQVVWHERVCLCMCVSDDPIVGLEARHSLDNYQMYGAVKRPGCAYVKDFVQIKRVSVYWYTYVVLYSWAGTHEVTTTYSMHKIPHRSSWNQLPIIAPDIAVHPQPQCSATGAEIQEISPESCQSCVAKTQKVFLFHLWYSIHMTTPKMKMWGRYMAPRTTFACLKLCHFPFRIAAPVSEMKSITNLKKSSPDDGKEGFFFFF